MDSTTFGNALRAYREEHKLSQQELASILGTSKQVLSRYETGQRDPKISTAREYAEKLHLPLSYFLKSSFEEEMASIENNEPPTPSTKYNVLKIAGRDGSFSERLLSDEQLAALKAILDQMPDASDDL